MNEDDRYKMLAEKIFMGESRLIPMLFGAIATPEEADVLLALPGTAATVAGQFAMSEQDAGSILDTLFRKGLVFKKATPEGTSYRMCRDLMQFHDASILWPEAPRPFLDLWQEFMEEEWPAFSEMVEKMLPRPVTRVVPVSESVDARQQILAYEDVRSMIDAADIIAVTNCTCRLTAQKCDRPVEICMQLGKAGSYAIERGTG
ncbi:MAG: 4Fe-4S binding protein, partial [Candidatus Geothermincolia bacterium]